MEQEQQKFFSKFPVIDLGDYVLRDLSLADAEAYFEMMNDPEVADYQSEEDVPSNFEEAKAEVKFWSSLFYRKHSIFWAIADSKTNALMGSIGFNNWNYNNRRGEISYDLLKEYRRKGIMTNCISKVLRFSFDNMNLYRVEARTMLGNIPSHKILEKIGFEKEGVQKGYRIIRGEPADIALYGITKDAYYKSHPNPKT